MNNYTYKIEYNRYNLGDFLVEFIDGKKNNVWILEDLFNSSEVLGTKRYDATLRAKEYIRKNHPELLI
jgi:hypothetical protein